MAETETCVDCFMNATTPMPSNATGPPDRSGLLIVSNLFYVLILVIGLVGNGLVIYAILRYAKMKTVTNIYILNLAIADLLFIIGLPFLIVTALLAKWVFGFIMCKVFMFLTSINWFSSVFTLTVMSADRYIAVCHPMRSMRFRTPSISIIVCICVWCGSLLVMLPIILYTTTVDRFGQGTISCTIEWPDGQPISADQAFIWYSMLLGFGIPMILISIFYFLLVLRLRTVGPKTKSKEKKKTHRRVTIMVLSVIAVYVICWLPYWVFQICLTLIPQEKIPNWVYQAFPFITIFSYANSAANPVLYAFLSDNFRKSFVKAFKCANASEVNNVLNAEHSVFPAHRKGAGGIALSNAAGKVLTAATTTSTTIATQRTHLSADTQPLTPNSHYTASPGGENGNSLHPSAPTPDDEDIQLTEEAVSAQNKEALLVHEPSLSDHSSQEDHASFIVANHKDIENELKHGHPEAV